MWVCFFLQGRQVVPSQVQTMGAQVHFAQIICSYIHFSSQSEPQKPNDK